ncbi:signal transducer and activator of transcription B [Eurosta solidaginis]|uniref:signal transducer and activator of transcription B n=1 Tax=Eurosta solidaginis TaxID=178769 RepID=UPI003531101B
MAPTICSEKKPRQIRSNLKEIRRQQNSSSTILSTAAAVGSSSNSVITTVSKSNGNALSNSSRNIDYVAAPRNVRSRINSEISSAIETTSLQSMRINRLHLELHQQQQQPSDNIVSPSRTRRELLRNAKSNQMDTDDDITDEEDFEVHSITSGAHCKNNNRNYNNTTNYNSMTNTNNQHLRQFVQCLKHDDDDKTIFQTTQSAFSLNDKQGLNTISTANNSNHAHNSRRHYVCDENEEMFEMKNTEGLLAIALKTIKLVKRNQILQQRLTQLQHETSEFIESVLRNPENQHFRDKMSQSPVSSPSISSATPSPLSSLSSSQSPQSTTMTAALTTTRQQSSGAAEA